MRKYPSLNYPAEADGLGVGETVFVQEKLDGANFRFMLRKHLDESYEEDRDLVFGSRNVVWKNEDDVAGAFTDHPETGVGALEYVRENVEIPALNAVDRIDDDGIVVYGEAMHPHTLEYDWNQVPRVVVYDIWKRGDQSYVAPDTLKATCRSIGLPWAPYHDEVPATEYGSVSVPQSAFRDGKAEGVVLKNPESNVRAKLVTEAFKEKHGGPSPSSTNHVTDTDVFVDRYITDARIEKCAHKLVDQGAWNGLKMEMMRDLPEAVIRDALDEEAGTIVMEHNWTLDTSEIRSKASTRCARTLKGCLQ